MVLGNQYFFVSFWIDFSETSNVLRLLREFTQIEASDRLC